MLRKRQRERGRCLWKRHRKLLFQSCRRLGKVLRLGVGQRMGRHRAAAAAAAAARVQK